MSGFVGTNRTFGSVSQTVKDLISCEMIVGYHFNIPTYLNITGDELESGSESVELFTPYNLNVGSWIDQAVRMGARGVFLTTMFNGGFTLWPSLVDSHGIQGTTWYAGSRRDIVREFVEYARLKALRVGFYFSIQSKYNEPATPAAYQALVSAHLTELLTQYGKIDFICFDASPWAVSYATVPYSTYQSLVRIYQPNCVIINNNHEHDLTHTDIDAYEMSAEAAPAAGITSRPIAQWFNAKNALNGWFDHPDRVAITEAQLKDMIGMLGRGQASGYLNILNMSPNALGTLPTDFTLMATRVYQPNGTLFGHDSFVLTSGNPAGTILQNNTSVEGVAWIKDFGDADLVISPDGECWMNYNLGAEYYYNVTPATADYRTEIDFKFLTNPQDFVLILDNRLKTDGTQAYRWKMLASGATATMTLEKLSGGSVTSLVTAALGENISLTKKYTMTLACRGTDILARLYIDGHVWGQFYVSDNTISAANKPGFVLIGSGSATTGLHVTDFRARTETLV